MTTTRLLKTFVSLFAAASALGFSAASGALPSDRAAKILSARNLGLAQLEEGKNKDARATFERLGALVPNEALPWADAAIAALRDGDLPECARLLERATKAGGDRAEVWALTAALEEARNHPEPARAAFLRAAAKEPKDLESRWRFIKSVESGAGASVQGVEARATRKRLLAEILAASPANLPARLKLLALELEPPADDAGGRSALAELERLLADTDVRTRTFLSECRAALESGDVKGASLKARVIENLQRVTPRYQQSLAELFTNIAGIPITRFTPAFEASLRPAGSPAIPVNLRESKTTAEDPALTLRRVDLKNDGSPVLYAIPAPYTRATFSDVDLDGDLDIYLSGGGRADRLVRNNLDGTFADITLSMGDVSEREIQSRVVIAGDVDRDGDPDFVTINEKGELLLRSNLRQGRFKTSALGVSHAMDVAADDLNADGFLDLAVLTREGVVVLINQGNGTFRREESAATKAPAQGAAVLLADLDNDGLPDLIVGGGKGLVIFRRSGPGGFSDWPIAPKQGPATERMLALDADHDGDLDLVLWNAGKGVVMTNDGGNANGWLDVVVEGLPLGSGKVNRAGVGSLVEVKAGDLYVSKTVGLLPTHVGIAGHGTADVVRCLFPNGIPQNVFDARARTIVREVQVLKGSCPFIYARNGSTGRWSFISDALGRAPLGLLYDGVHLAGADPNEWLFIDGALLTPTKDGKLQIDYTEELWEVAFLDEARLVAVDHPEGTLVVPNERTIPGALEKKLYTVAKPRAPRRAWSVAGRALAGGTAEPGLTDVIDVIDVTELIRDKDDLRVEPGRPTAYQGVREDHALVLDLGPVAPADRVVLYLNGWILYADTSINVSISQRSDLRSYPPVLEVPDGRGGWRVAMESFGFPAGKTKTMPVELTGVLNTQDPRVRIRTTMAVFWDQVFFTLNDESVKVTMTSLLPARATLSERGFSRRFRESPDGPEVFAHDDVSTAPVWEDVPGLVTRLGDVTDLLQKSDDRWVAFKGGDSIRIEYDAASLPALRSGWRRDWILVSEGWDKDFDKNTVSGERVGPYPFHAMSSYPYPDDERFPDPAFLREWVTRKVGPAEFRAVLRDAGATAERRP